jgi:hypothetical protein
LCTCPLCSGFSPFVLLKKKKKSRHKLGFWFTLATQDEKTRKEGILQELRGRDRKRTRVERKMKRKQKVKEAFAALP